MMRHLLEQFKDDKKAQAFLLNHFLEQFRTTVFRQTMFAEFEYIAHTMAEQGQPLTREALANRDVPLYFQTEDTYAVAAESADHPMLIALCTPEGYYFCYESTYYFSPEFSGCDMWYLDLSPLFADYERFVAEEERWPGGSYQVLYCIDGQIAGEFAFELGE